MLNKLIYSLHEHDRVPHLHMHHLSLYPKIPLNSDNKPWAYICSKGFIDGLIFGGAQFRRGFKIIGGNFVLQNGFGLTVKTVSSNSPWAYIREGLLSEGYLRLRFGGLIFGRAYFWEGLLSEFYGIYNKRQLSHSLQRDQTVFDSG